MQRILSIASAMSTTDYIMLGGITVIMYVLLRPKRNKQDEKLVNLKTLKLLPDTAQATKQADSEKSLIDKMKASGKNMVVFFGSQTGTAEEFSQRLVKNSRLYGIKGLVVDPEEIDMEDFGRLTEIENCVAIFIVATYGEGDPTDNAQELYGHLQNGQVDLTGLKYAVSALGLIQNVIID
jgi:sulfite reductase alpha subunit-like flavoprotein